MGHQSKPKIIWPATAADQGGEQNINQDAKIAGKNVISSISNSFETNNQVLNIILL